MAYMRQDVKGNKLAMSSTNSYLGSVLTSVLLDIKIIERKEHVFFYINIHYHELVTSV